jgi:EspG family
MAMAARDGDEVVIDAVGESDSRDEQVDLICNAMLPAFGDAAPADVEGVNIPAGLMYSTLANAAPHGRDVLTAALARLGLAPPLTEVLTAAARFDESAMAVVSLIDTGVTPHVHPRVLTIADTDHGRVSITTSASADGKEWMTIWPTTPTGLRDDLAALLAVPQAA